jgi:hypothetical protein
MRKQRVERGQSLLEIALVLPIFVILLFGVVETGFGLRNYLLVCNANREGTRFASRGRFSDTSVVDRVVSAGGVVRMGGVDVPFLRTHGTDPNTGVIITHVQLDSDGTVVSNSTWISGVVVSGGVVRSIALTDTKIVLADIVNRHAATVQEINALRVAEGYAEMAEHVVVVETFFAHHLTLGKGLFPEPWVMYTQTEMRITTDRSGGGGSVGE